MPQENMSSKLGNSSSPVVNRIIQNNKNVQQPCDPQTATKDAYNKQTVNVGGK